MISRYRTAPCVPSIVRSETKIVNLRFRIWLIATVTLVVAMMIIRLCWQVSVYPFADTVTYVTLLILALLSGYALFVYLTIKPNRKKLQSLPVVIWIMVIATAGTIGGAVHFARFVSSPEADHPLSIVLAALLFLAGISAYFLLLWLIWWKARER